MTDETKRAQENVDKTANREKSATPDESKGAEIREEKS